MDVSIILTRERKYCGCVIINGSLSRPDKIPACHKIDVRDRKHKLLDYIHRFKRPRNVVLFHNLI